MKIGNGKHSCYMSFKGIDLNNRVGWLHLNDMTNVQVKFDILENTNAKEISNYKRNKYQIHNLLLEVKIVKTPIFIGIEQGSEKYQSSTLVITTVRIRVVAH